MVKSDVLIRLDSCGDPISGSNWQQQHGIVAVDQPKINNTHGIRPQSEIQLNVVGAIFDCLSKIYTDKTGVYHPFNILSPHCL